MEVKPFAYLEEFVTVLKTIGSNPLFILKPKSTFVERDPLYFTLFLLIIFIGYTYFRTKKSDNLSWVDRLWSVMPPIYVGSMLLHAYYHDSGKISQRLAFMFLLQLGWGARLTYNLAIKGGYKSVSEDYRWETIRTWFAGQPMKYELFIFFVNILLQNVVIWAFSVLPSYVVYYGDMNGVKQSPFDLLIVVLYMAFFLIETIADYQMFDFQMEKKRIILSREFSNINLKFAKGFFQEGLYRYSRHPNYFGELGIWLCVYLLSCIVAPLNWSVIGWLSLCGIFWYSIDLTESLSTFKYPPYKYYAKRTSKLIPWFPGADKTKKSQ